MSPKVYILVLNWENYEETIVCVDSLNSLNYDNFEIIIIDNGSKNQSERILREKFPSITVLQTGRNLGYTGGNNFGMNYLNSKDYDYVYILNNDTKVYKDSLRVMVNYFASDSRIAAVGPISCYMKAPELIQSAGMEINLVGMRIRQKYIKQNYVSLAEKAPYEVDCLNGVAILIKRTVLEQVGLFDEQYFMYNDEVDLCYRIIKRGYRLFVIPSALILHNHPLDGISHFAEYYITRGKGIFLRKFKLRRLIPFFVFQILKTCLKLVITGPRVGIKSMIAYLRGLFAGLTINVRADGMIDQISK